MKKIILAIALAASLSQAAASYWWASNGDYRWGPFANYSACSSAAEALRNQGFWGVDCFYR